jgi:hypothetical protein
MANIDNECVVIKYGAAALQNRAHFKWVCNSSRQIFISLEYEKQTELLSKKF